MSTSPEKPKKSYKNKNQVRGTTGYCGAKLRNKDATCRNYPGLKTEHPGEGRCYRHGGNQRLTTGGIGPYAKHRLGPKIREHAKNPDPLNLLPEVALLRAYAEDWLDRYDEIFGPEGALIAWHESFKNPEAKVNKPTQIIDVSYITNLIDRIGVMADRIFRQQQQTGIPLATVGKIYGQMGEGVMLAAIEIGLNEETRTELLDAIERKWGLLSLTPK
jgi:hypothetical protein